MNLLPQDGEVYYFPDLFTSEEENRYFQSLLADTPWLQEPIKIFGKEILQPRLTSWFGDEGVDPAFLATFGTKGNSNCWA